MVMPSPIEFRIFSDDQRIYLYVYNQGKVREPKGPGRGLVMSVERLQPYEATVDFDKKPSAPWTFGVKIAFRRGKLPCRV